MYGSNYRNLPAQRGVSLSGLIVGLGLIIAVSMLGMKVFPTFLEYRSAKDGIASAKRQGGTPAEMREAFNKHADINTISALDGKDLIITKVNEDIEVSFDYEQKIELFTNVALVIHYAGTTDKSGVIPEKPETPVQ
jgi:hypothetical protein